MKRKYIDGDHLCNNIVDNIQYICERKGISIHSIEKNVGLNHGCIKRWRKHTPSFDKVFNVAVYLGIPCEKLVSK